MNSITYHEALALGEIIRYSRGSMKVARVWQGGVIYGIARAICTQPNGGFVGEKDDVRDGFLWVTMREGFEQWWPVRDLMAEYATQEFSQYDW